MNKNTFEPRGATVAALCAVVLALAGCASTSGQRRVWSPPESQGSVRPTPSPRPLEAGPIVEQPQPQPGVQPLPDFPRSAEEVSGSAVTALMRQARSALDAGQPAQAASALERALRIEPRNYFVWSLLAKTHLTQGNYAQADSVAGKSNALARGNVYVELENWRTIAAARQAQGDAAGAEDASSRAQELERWLAERAPQ
ncbi:tetratricopeptide repeat protein [Fontimonas sp. SYSU GA230001]|uniref:tetratricopeptide repeat protein n=1 Tax=Fontimonas sp. SYSU GA230001 TaxID=3142450 RepID=UPI0032B5CCE1